MYVLHMQYVRLTRESATKFDVLLSCVSHFRLIFSIEINIPALYTGIYYYN